MYGHDHVPDYESGTAVSHDHRSVVLDTGTLGMGGVVVEEEAKLEAQPLRLLSSAGGRRYDCVLVAAGRVRRRDGRPGNWVIDEDALRAAVAKFAEVAVFVDHPGFLEGRKVRDLAGVVESDVRFEERELRATIRFNELRSGQFCADLFDYMLAEEKAGREVPDVGLSAVFFHRTEYVDDDRVTVEFVHVESVDVVFGPGAKGAVRAALQAINPGAEPRGGTTMGQDTVVQTPEGGGDGAPPVVAVATATGGNESPSELALALELQEKQRKALEREQERAQELLRGQCATFLNAQLRTLAGELPQASIDHLKKQFGGAIFEPDELEAAVGEQRELLAALTENRSIRGMGVITGAQTGLDRLEMAYEQLMGLPGNYGDVERLTGIRELYFRLTGDRDLRGMFNPDYAMLYTDASTMAEVTRNVLNKVLLAQWVVLGEAGYNWWERVCHIADFPSIQAISWVTVDGFADLSTVADGGTYQEITWDDSRETATFTKKGGYVGLTLEMIDKDDIGAWRAVPRGLATAGIRTVSGLVAAIFTDNNNTGPTLNSDSKVTFHADHNNLIGDPLDVDGWDTAVQTMFKQEEQGSSKRLGIRPTFCLVPVELEKRALQIFGSEVEPTAGVFYANVRRTNPDNVITVPEWTDTENWAAMADPRIAPGIGVGFRWGRVPELFTVTHPAMGLMFTNDVMPIKVRYMMAVGVMNYRAMVKSNV